MSRVHAGCYDLGSEDYPPQVLLCGGGCKGAARHKAGQRKQGGDLTPQAKHRKAFLGVLGVAVLLSS